MPLRGLLPQRAVQEHGGEGPPAVEMHHLRRPDAAHGLRGHRAQPIVEMPLADHERPPDPGPRLHHVVRLAGVGLPDQHLLGGVPHLVRGGVLHGDKPPCVRLFRAGPFRTPALRIPFPRRARATGDPLPVAVRAVQRASAHVRGPYGDPRVMGGPAALPAREGYVRGEPQQRPADVSGCALDDPHPVQRRAPNPHAPSLHPCRATLGPAFLLHCVYPRSDTSAPASTKNGLGRPHPGTRGPRQRARGKGEVLRPGHRLSDQGHGVFQQRVQHLRLTVGGARGFGVRRHVLALDVAGTLLDQLLAAGVPREPVAP